MIYNFANGTNVQQSMWREAVGHLLHLPSSAINLSVSVTFQPTIPGGHTDLALTTWAYGSTSASTVVRDDALHFGPSQAALEAEAAGLGLPYSAEKFYLETAVHELAHALYASLPEEHRVQIAELFGAKGDSIEELQPKGSAWQDRIMEGIAETFKEAFLPRRYRVFPNRTNRRISYSEFRRFRSLWRAGVEVSGGVAPSTTDLLAGIDNNLIPLSPVWHSAVKNVEAFVRFSHTFGYSFTVPRNWFAAIVGPTKGETGGSFSFALRIKDKATNNVLHLIRGYWFLDSSDQSELSTENWDEELVEFFDTIEAPNVPRSEDLSEGGNNHWLLYAEKAVALGKAPFTYADSFAVAGGTTIVVDAFAFVSAGGLIVAGEPPPLPVFNEIVRAVLPDLVYDDPGLRGSPIDIPASGLLSGGAAGASHPHGHPITGNMQ